MQNRCATLGMLGLPAPADTFRDPVHGYIGVYEWEKEIIDTRTFQRLRSIRQLGPTFYLYHGAEHSRFGHSLGVMHLAGRVVGNILQNQEARQRVSAIWPDGDPRATTPEPLWKPASQDCYTTSDMRHSHILGKIGSSRTRELTSATVWTSSVRPLLSSAT